MSLWSSILWFDSESGQSNAFKVGIHCFYARRSAVKGWGQRGEQAGKFTCCVVVGAHLGDLAPGQHSSEKNIATVVSRWRYCARFDRKVIELGPIAAIVMS